MQTTVKQYVMLDDEIEQISELLKTKKLEREMLKQEIVEFCNSHRKSKINLPDGRNLCISKTTSYQNLSYVMLEKSLNDFNKKVYQHIPVKQLIDFLKSVRSSKSTFELRLLKR